MTVSDFIESLGGTIKVAILLGLPRHTAVSNWRSLDAIPPKHRKRFERVCKAQGIDLPPALFREITESERRGAA